MILNKPPFLRPKIKQAARSLNRAFIVNLLQLCRKYTYEHEEFNSHYGATNLYQMLKGVTGFYINRDRRNVNNKYNKNLTQ